MSSSYVEVREAENGTEENALPIAIDTCESNGIVSMSAVDGEPQKDHTYNKEPLEVQGEVEVMVSSEDVEDTEVSIGSPEKSKRTKRQRNSSPKKVAQPAAKKDVSKRAPNSRKKAVKEEKTKPTKKEEKEPEEISEDKQDGSVNEKETSSTKKPGRKRKASENNEKEPKAKKEKLDLKKNKPGRPKALKKEVEESKEEEKPENVEKSDEIKNDEKEAGDKTPSKPTRKSQKSSALTKKASDNAPGEDDSNIPEGWTRKVVQRKSGKTAGIFDVYIYSPEGKKLRSRPDLAAYLAKIKSPLKVDDFNFSVPSKGTPQRTPSVKKSTPTPAKAKSSPKATNASGKKKTSPVNSKKSARLVVKLNFSPKKRILSNYEAQEKSAKRGDTVKSEGRKKATPKTPAKRQKTQTKKKAPTKQSKK